MLKMVGNKTKLLEKSFWLLAGRALPVIILVVITILFSRSLNYNDYGTFQSVWMYTNIINIIISFGFSSIILSTNLSFLFQFIKNHRKIIFGFYAIISIGGLFTFFILAKNFNTGVRLWLIVFIIIQNIITVAETLLIKRGNVKLSFTINLFYALLFLGCHLYILFSNYSLLSLIISLCVLSVLKIIAIVSIPVKNETYEHVADEKHFLKHWAYLGFTEILGVIAKWIDKAFLLYLLTAVDFAVFFNGSFEIPLFGLLISVAGSFMLIEFSRNLKSENKILALFKESFNMLSSIVFPLFFFLFFFREEIFAIVFKNKYSASVPIFEISVFILPLRINNYSVILQCFAQGKRIMLGSLIDIILALLLMIILYPVMGSEGIALSIVISTYCQVLYYLWYSSKVLQVKFLELFPLQKLLVKFIILLSLYSLIFLLMKQYSIMLRLTIAMLITALSITIGMWSYFKTFFKNNHGQG
ncbi:oligosaccharide flippase family protein [Ginsengibacter hankyongi]|uniref:Oligosaccharide flippase family protein n=1 Tax=Ginsengibacter hankyongi TaxID=2607284 RepID=A0A5J5ICM1_9BACT|nr:polysaccharide biosynthesis C-terminal domain-containing protein [Ginsengibacter hankyongi]KAA9036639.1 oligosaccharide flippase family protein [Ginsengibacter hankyongi]